MGITSTVTLSGLQQAAMEHAVHYGYRPANLFRTMGGISIKYDVGSDPQHGQQVTFTKLNKLAANTTALPEFTDISPSSLGTSTVVVTIAEQGDVVQTTKKLRVTAFVDLENLVVMREVGKSMGQAADLLVRTQGFDQATNLIFPGSATTDNTVVAGATGKISGALIAKARAKLAGGAVPGIAGGVVGKGYRAMVHPDIVVDITSETGGHGWRDAQNQNAAQGTEGIDNEIIGRFSGCDFVENANCKVNTAATNADVYSTYIYGEEAIAEANAVDFDVRLSGPYDSLLRFLNTGWYFLGGWNLFRPESLFVIRTDSSIGARP